MAPWKLGAAASSPGRRGPLGLVLLLWLGCEAGPEPLSVSPPTFLGGEAIFDIAFWPTLSPVEITFQLDGRDRSREDGVVWQPRVGVLRVPVSPGPHTLLVDARFDADTVRGNRSASVTFVVPAALPTMATSMPSTGAPPLPLGEWIDVEFTRELSWPQADTLSLECGAQHLPRRIHRLTATRLIVDPIGLLPPGASCRVSWQGVEGPVGIHFETAPERARVYIPYVRSRALESAPFPDDYFTRADPESPTGLRVALPARTARGLEGVVDALRDEIDGLSGFSPIAHLLVEFSDAVDPLSLPATPDESLAPGASVLLVDLDASTSTSTSTSTSSTGRRVPFRIDLRTDVDARGRRQHSALIFPSIPLRPGGRYGLLITRRARARSGASFEPSVAMARVLGPASPFDPEPVLRARELIAPVLEVAESQLFPPLEVSDISLALRFTVRDMDGLPADLLAIRAQTFSAPPPELEVLAVRPGAEDSPVAAVVHGRWRAPEWRRGNALARDALGRPMRVDQRWLPFVMSLPAARGSAPAPIVMYQHGTPGSAEAEVPSRGRDALLRAGFAVAGFTDVINRELVEGGRDPKGTVARQALRLLVATLLDGRVPDYWLQTNAEQLAFVRMLPTLSSLDLLPLGTPDGIGEIDGSAPLSYVGVSEGANLAPGLLAYAPEVRAAVLIAGGGRLSELMIYQQGQALVESLPGVFEGASPLDVWLTLSLFQMAFDRQDGHNHARFVYRARSPAIADPRRASIMLVAGVGDTLVPNHATDSLAWQLGPMPLLGLFVRPLPFLPRAHVSVTGNIDVRTTAAYRRMVPTGIPGMRPSPGCTVPLLHPDLAREGHFCAQLAEESRLERATFLLSAQGSGAPTIALWPGPTASPAAGRATRP